MRRVSLLMQNDNKAVISAKGQMLKSGRQRSKPLSAFEYRQRCCAFEGDVVAIAIVSHVGCESQASA